MVFHRYFQAGKREEFRQKSTLFSHLRWRLPIFGQINIGWIPCLGFSFFCAILGRIICGRILLRHLVYWFGFGVNYLRPNFATVFGLLFWFGGEGVGELLGYLGVGDSDDVCCGGGEAEEVDVAVPHN